MDTIQEEESGMVHHSHKFQLEKEEGLKILAICGSPHKGKTLKVLKWIKSAYPNIDLKIMKLAKMNLKPCKGCDICVLNGEEFCPLKDDRTLILDQMLAADGVIFASPVYVNHISALMQSFFERLRYNSHRPQFYKKFAMVISVINDYGAKESNEYMENIVSSFGFDVISKLEIRFLTNSEKEDTFNFKQTFDAFNSFLIGIKKGIRKPPTVDNLVKFHLFKHISETYKEKYKADYAYYKDKKEYPYDGQINVFKKMLTDQYVQRFEHETKVLM